MALLSTLLAVLSLALSGQAASPTSPAAALRIDGVEVAGADYRAWLLARRGEFQVETVLLHRRVLALADAEGCRVPDVVIESILEGEIATRVEGAFGGERERWLAELHGAGRSEAGRRIERRIDLEIDRNLMAIVAARNPVEEHELRAEWQRLFGEEGRRPKARLLFQRFVQQSIPGESREDRRARREREIEALRTRVLAIRARAEGGESFETLVRALSEDGATRETGGLVAAGLDLHGWPSTAVEAIHALEGGAISPPLFAQGGFWLVRSEGWTDVPFESVREQIEERVRSRGPDGRDVAELRRALSSGAAEALQPAFFVAGAPDDTVLIVDGEPITRDAVERFVAGYRGEHYTRRFAEWFVLGRLAAEAGVVATSEEVSERVDTAILRTIESAHEGDRAAWLESLGTAGRTEEFYRRELAHREHESLLLERLLRRAHAPTEAEVRGLWERLHGPGGRRLGARWIRLDLVAPDLPPDADQATIRAAHAAARASKLAEAEALRQRLAAGEDFGALAREVSDDVATRSRGGEPAPGVFLEDLVRDPAQLFEPLERGALGGPLEFDGAFWLFELLDVTEVRFEDVRDELFARALQERPNELVLLEYRRELLGDPVVEVLRPLAGE
ncbi:MAG: peptidylprolyl isomerase [Planctomycetota bacterium]